MLFLFLAAHRLPYAITETRRISEFHKVPIAFNHTLQEWDQTLRGTTIMEVEEDKEFVKLIDRLRPILKISE
jgi:hypothetical protein